MAINVRGAKEGYTSEQIIKEALAERIEDVDGRIFELITLVATIPAGENSSTHGYTDTFIDVIEQGRIKIKHGIEGRGRIKWMRSRRGTMEGQLAKIPANVDLLAANYRFGLWKIKDPLQDEEIKVLSEERLKSMTREQVQEEDNRISEHHESKWGGRAVNRQGKTSADIAREVEMTELRKKQNELKQKEEELKRRELELRKKENDPESVKIDRDDLMKTSVFKLRKIARTQFGLSVTNESKRQELVDLIMKAHEGNETAYSLSQKEPEKTNNVITG